jgi:hypothetical protein
MRKADILVDTDLREVRDLKEVGGDLDLPSRLAKMSAFFKAVDVETSEFVGDTGGHGERGFVDEK